MKKDDGGHMPAFPGVGARRKSRDIYLEHYPGASLRELFAGLALIGLIVAVPKIPDGDIARQAYGLANAMLQEREKEE